MLIINKAKMNEFSFIELNRVISLLEKEIIEFNLNGFNGLIIEDDNMFPNSSDGRMINKTILLPKNRTEENLRYANYKVKSTIYHELCHVDLSNKLPNIHEEYNKSLEKENYVKAFTIHTYIEYITHIKSIKFESEKSIDEFIQSVNNKKWNFSSNEDDIYMVKAAPYIIARNYDLSRIENQNLKNRLFRIKSELERLEKIRIEDDYVELFNLEKIIKQYIRNEEI